MFISFRFDPCEHPISCQLGGSDPDLLVEAALMVEKEGYDEININCGCPSPKVAKGNFGASLMLSPDLVSIIVRELKKNIKIPITIKCRLGVDEHDTYEDLCNFIHKTEIEGIDHYIIHCRKAFLNGINPKKNREIPPLNYNIIYKLLDDFPHIHFSLNGGLNSLEQGKLFLERNSTNNRHISGVMYGRLLSKDSLSFQYVDSLFYNKKDQLLSRAEIIYNYLQYIQTMRKNQDILIPSNSILVRPLYPLFTTIPHSNNFKSLLNTSLFQERLSLEDSLRKALICIDKKDMYNQGLMENTELLMCLNDFFHYS